MPCTSVDPHITQHSAFRKLHKTLENFIEQWKTLLIRETPKTETYQQMHRYWTEWNCFRHEVKHHWTPQKASERHGSVENNEQYWTLLTLPRKCKKKNCITFELYVRFLKVDKLCVRQFSRRRWSVFKWTTKVRYDLELCVHGDQCLILHFVSIAYEKMWCAVGVPVDKSRFVSACSSCSFLHFCFASTKSLNWSLIACSLKFNKKFPDFSFWFFLATETTWEWFSDSIASYLVRSVPQPTQNLTKKTYGVCHYRAIFPKSYCKHHFWISGLSSRCHVLCGAWSDAQMVDVWHHGYDFFLMTWPGINKLSHLALFNNRFFSVSCMHLQHVQLITLAFPDNKATSAVYLEKSVTKLVKFCVAHAGDQFFRFLLVVLKLLNQSCDRFHSIRVFFLDGWVRYSWKSGINVTATSFLVFRFASFFDLRATSFFILRAMFALVVGGCSRFRIRKILTSMMHILRKYDPGKLLGLMYLAEHKSFLASGVRLSQQMRAKLFWRLV